MKGTKNIKDRNQITPKSGSMKYRAAFTGSNWLLSSIDLFDIVNSRIERDRDYHGETSRSGV